MWFLQWTQGTREAVEAQRKHKTELFLRAVSILQGIQG
jgi:hypothetical protein